MLGPTDPEGNPRVQSFSAMLSASNAGGYSKPVTLSLKHRPFEPGRCGG